MSPSQSLSQNPCHLPENIVVECLSMVLDKRLYRLKVKRSGIMMLSSTTLYPILLYYVIRLTGGLKLVRLGRAADTARLL